MKIVILIPSYNPDSKLTKYVSELSQSYVDKILVIDDGSGKEYQDIFDECKGFEKCHIISYDKNMGKGFALKTGMKYYMDNFADYDGVLTCDSDGQHLQNDTLKIADEIIKNKNALVLGVRDFNRADIPWRSKFGNTLTSNIFRLLFHEKIVDTQTGLRGIPTKLIPFMLGIKGNRFEYETNVLVNCFNSNIQIVQTPICTVYIDGNSSSHFNAVVDSAKIYWVIFREYILYASSAVVCFLIDIILYSLIVRLGIIGSSAYGIYIASYSSRIISSVCNFGINKSIVFKSDTNMFKAALKYALTVLLIITISSNAVKLISVMLSIPVKNTPIIKICVDTVLFCLTYIIEKYWVLK